MSSAVNNTPDLSHNWVWGLQKGEKVWVALEEIIAQSEKYYIDFLCQIGPSEYESLNAIFMPYEMEIVNNWTMRSGKEESHILSLQYTIPSKSDCLLFACQCDNRDLHKFFSCGNKERVSPTMIFKTRALCEEFCQNNLLMYYTTELCDSIIGELSNIISRIKNIRGVCYAEENGTDHLIARHVAKMMD